MRFAGALVLASTLALAGVMSQRTVQAQSSAQKVAAAKKATPAKKAPAAKKAAPVAQPGRDVYPTMPLGERVAIQFDLAWSGHYNGLITGEFTDKAIAAIRAFQKDHRFKETGVLAAPERATLAALSKAKQDQVGWRMVDDPATGAQVGLPTKQIPRVSRVGRGTRWASAQGQVQVETFRVREPGATLATVMEQQKGEPATRKLEVNLLRNDFFILSGTQGLKKFYVRAEVRDLEIRGLTILWDPATEVIMDPVVVVMSSAFAPFPGSGLTELMGPAPRRKVEYGTGIVLTGAGHILTDQKLTEACNFVEIAGYGDAHRLAQDDAAGVALLQVFGAPALAPLALAPGATDTDLTLVGIADPQSQGGGRAVSAAAARLGGDGLQPVPPLGFAGAAALDAQGRFVGMVALTTPMVASAGAATVPAPQAKLVPTATIQKFLDTQNILPPAAGAGGADAARSAVVRVICVRR